MKLHPLVAAASLAAVACSSEPDAVPGPNKHAVDLDASGASDASSAPDAADTSVADDATTNPDDWSYVYARYFAAGTAGHCGNAGCHGTVRRGFLCGDTKDRCFEGLVAAGLVNFQNPARSSLGNLLDSPLAWFGVDGEGFPSPGPIAGKMPADEPMPNKGAADAVVRWLAAGAKNEGWMGSHGGDAGTDGETEGGIDGGIDGSPDATPDARPDAPHDAPSDAVHDAPHESGGGPTWSALYAGYFGPGTVGHCGNVGCHASTQAGFKCGASATTCYNGLVNKGLINPTNPSQSIFANPQLTPLSWFGGAGPMPKDQAGPNAAAAQAVTAWVAAGVPNN